MLWSEIKVGDIFAHRDHHLYSVVLEVVPVKDYNEVLDFKFWNMDDNSVKWQREGKSKEIGERSWEVWKVNPNS